MSLLTDGILPLLSVDSYTVYCKSMLTEVVLSGIPHLVMQDDVYKEMFIPKGSVVIANALYASFPTLFLNVLTLAVYVAACREMRRFTQIQLNSIQNGSYLNLLGGMRSCIQSVHSGSDDGE